MDAREDRIGWPVAAGSSLTAFLLTLLLPSGLAALFTSEPFRLGLPQFAAALAVAILMAVALLLRERAAAVRLAAAGEALARAESDRKHQAGLAQGILDGLPMPYLLEIGRAHV